MARHIRAAAIVAALIAVLTVAPNAKAFDGFNVLSSSFDNLYEGSDIWNGAAFQNGWDGDVASGGTTTDYSLNGSNLVYNFSTNNGWWQHDNNATPWELGGGSWTVEVRARVGSTGGNSGFVIWGALNGERDILTVREGSVTNLGGTVFDSSDNTDGFHDYRLVYDSGADVYHYFRDAVQLTPLAGVPQQGGTGNTRLIVGDCCTNVGGSPFGGVGSSFELEYIRYDMDGAFSPTSDQGVTSVTINRDTGNITLANTTSTAIENIIGYSLLSDAGGLSPSNWNQQASGSQLANDDDDWTVVSGPGATTDLSEAVLSTSGAGDGGDLAASTGSINFGNVWTQSPFEDVTLELLLDDGTILTSGTDFQLAYEGNGDQPFGLGDLAGATVNDGPDGDIDLVDWQKFKSAYGSDLTGLSAVAAYLNSDVNGDGVSNISDFNEFRSLYDAANGAGAFAEALSRASVPEPTTAVLAMLAAAFALTSSCGLRRHAQVTLVAMIAAIISAPTAEAQVPVAIFSDDFQAYPVTDPADFSATGNWTHNGAGSAPNASRIFDTGNYGGTRLWIASAANAAAGTGLNSRGITAAEGLLGGADYTFSAALVTETFNGTRTATGSYDLLVGQTFGTATSVIGGPQAFEARGDSDASIAGSIDDTYDDQRTTLAFNSGAVDAGDQLFISIAFDGTDETNAFVGVDEVQVSAEAMLGARVNTTTGNVSLFGDDVFDFDIASYSLTSPMGNLVPGNLTSLEGQGVGDPAMTDDDGIGFEVLGTPSATEIAEGHLTTSTVFDDATNLSLGAIFDTATLEEDRDLALTLTTATGDELVAIVEYDTGGGILGDSNGDGIVNTLDIDPFVLALTDAPGYMAAFPSVDFLGNNDINMDGVVNTLDIDPFVALLTGGGAIATPEPGALLLAVSVAALALFARPRRGAGRATAWVAVAGCVTVSGAAFAAQNDREYLFGDDPDEVALDGVPMSGVTFDSAGSLGAGDLQDLSVVGSPTYVSVSDRPGALAGDLGAAFDGAGDSLNTGISMNAPSQMWDNPDFFPGPPPQIFPHNYEGIFSHGIQLWAKPDQSALGTSTQTLVSDTDEHGIGITAGGNWELLYDDGRFDTGVSVTSTLDLNGWAHVMEITEPGGGAFGGTLLVNGVAVLARATFYDPESTPLVIGADSNGEGGFENFYDGALDDVRLFFWGDNSDQLGQDGAPGGANSGGPDPAPIVLNADGQDWGDLDLGVTNDWIAQRLVTLGVTDDGDVDLSGGVADAADEAAFITHWRKQQLIDGVQVGDWNSRQEGDLNYDGIVDLRDAFILHDSLTAAGAGGFDFSLLSGATPEPCAALLAVLGVSVACVERRRRPA